MICRSERLSCHYARILSADLIRSPPISLNKLIQGYLILRSDAMIGDDSTFIFCLENRFDIFTRPLPQKGFGPSLRPRKDIWRRFFLHFAKLHVLPINLSHMQKYCAKKSKKRATTDRFCRPAISSSIRGACCSSISTGRSLLINWTSY